jgi:hypothetical protein
MDKRNKKDIIHHMPIRNEVEIPERQPQDLISKFKYSIGLGYLIFAGSRKPKRVGNIKP